MKIGKAKLIDIKAILKLEEKFCKQRGLLFSIKIRNLNEKVMFFVDEEKIVGYSRMHLLKWHNGGYYSNHFS